MFVCYLYVYLVVLITGRTYQNLWSILPIFVISCLNGYCIATYKFMFIFLKSFIISGCSTDVFGLCMQQCHKQFSSPVFHALVLMQVREATSNDPWGPSSSQMADISDLTYNVVACNEIMTMLWKRLKDDRNWRHIHKVWLTSARSTTLCVYCKHSL